MSILASLVRAYERQKDAPPFGYSRIEAAFCFVLGENGRLALDPIDLRLPGKRRMVGPKKNLPSPLVQRTSGIKPNFLWDKSAYSLGVTEKPTSRTAEENAAFINFHKRVLASSDDVGLRSFYSFVGWWDQKFFDKEPWFQDIKDQNIIFALEGSYRSQFLHERPAAKELWEKILVEEQTIVTPCLVTGRTERIALSHPPIKNVRGAQSSGAFIVSFNDDAYRSYNHASGDNAPVSEVAAFKYTTALNLFLEDDSDHRLQIGDASTVFWADAEDAEAALLAEALFPQLFNPTEEEEARSKDVGILLKRLKKGDTEIEEELALKSSELARKVEQGVQFYVLGLAPNAARISIRFYYESDFADLLENYRDYVADLDFKPRPKDRRITISGLVLRTAPARKDRNGQIKFDGKQVSPLLSGELFRAILTGDRFPRALLAQILMRVCSDHLLDSLRISMIKAVIVRDMRKEGRLPKDSEGKSKKDYLMRSDPDDPNPARRLGKLFALIERAQLAALGDKVKARGVRRVMALPLASKRLGFAGIADLVEFHPQPDGTEIPFPIEYKRGKRRSPRGSADRNRSAPPSSGSLVRSLPPRERG